MHIDILKCHGSENDFILIDEIKHRYGFSEDDRRGLTRMLSDRDQGIGSDGILFVLPSDAADARMRMFNSDGSEAEMCGNGLRCVARYIIEKLDQPQVKIETEKAVLSVKKVAPIYESIETFEVSIEPVSFDVGTLPLHVSTNPALEVRIPELTEDFTFTAVSMPNPHLVAVTEDYLESDLMEIGKKANQMKNVLPNGVNVSFVKMLDNQRVFVQTYERGVGLTNACGTAMSASSVVATQVGPHHIGQIITVLNKGGMVQCIVEHEAGEYTVKLRGNATNVYQQTLQVDLENRTFQVDAEAIYFPEEIQSYHELKQHAAKQG
ncbi:diaminopimelate epimerase [Thalassobacillus sp. CUG 92003]|uniref:diaminopimelate epimerase n=1 Tax=Thalassobacillus sp. CUG 92003 TaxID=2736641 RepID=UPI0015E69CC9|nr:diaminopimelate epimerase [Thalassobacillus sp. CUG 92003]